MMPIMSEKLAPRSSGSGPFLVGRNPISPVYRPRILSELGCALMWLGTVPGDNWFHEPSIEILERVPWGTA
jgi:hypothetical protein